MRPSGDPAFAPWALGHCEWLQPLGYGFFGVSAPGADLNTESIKHIFRDKLHVVQPVQFDHFLLVGLPQVVFFLSMDAVLGARDERPADRVGPRGQEFKEHAFEWLKPLATTDRPRGESRTTWKRSVQLMPLSG